MGISSNDTIRKLKETTKEETLTKMHKSNLIASLANAFGHGGEFTSSEYNTLYRWLYEMELPYDEVEFAMDFCVGVLGRQSFAYFNTVLSDWKRNGVTSKYEAMKYTYKNAKQSGQGENGGTQKKQAKARSIRFGNLYIPESGPVASVIAEPGGKVAIYVHGMPEKYTLEDGVSFEKAISIVDGSDSTIITDSIPKTSDCTGSDQVHEKLAAAYNALASAEWTKDPVSGGTEGQNKYANGVRDNTRKYVMKKCEEIISAGVPDAVTEEGLTAPVVTVMAEFVYRYFSQNTYYQKILDDYAKNTGILSPEGLAKYGKENL